MVQNTINTTVDVTTHALWGRLAKQEGLNRIDTLRFLVAREAKRLGLKVPRALEEFL